MCGIFGYAGNKPVPDIGKLDALARRAERRGPHAWGMAYWFGRRSFFNREANTYSESDDGVLIAAGASIVIGHCRLATSGTLDVEDTQPISWDGVTVAHNGNVYRPDVIASLYNLKPETACDSEIALRVMAGNVYRVKNALGIMGKTPFALLASDGQTFAAAAFGQPLYYDDQGYFCSWPFNDSKLLKEEIMFSKNVVEQDDHKMGEFEASRQAVPTRRQPVSNVVWLEPSALTMSWHTKRPNIKLREQLLNQGILRPIAMDPAGNILDVDDYPQHLVKLVKDDYEIRELTGGLVPVAISLS